MKKGLIPLFAILISISSQASDLDALCYSVALKSPSIAAEGSRLQAERLQGEVDNSLAGPDVDFDYKFADESSDNRWGVSVGQGFDWPGVYAARRKSNKLRANAFELLHRSNVVDKALELKLAAIRLGQARANLKVIGEAHSNFEQLVDNLRKSYDRGEATILAMRKSELQLMSILTALANAESEVLRAEAAIEAIEPGCLGEFKALAGLNVEPLRPIAEYEQSLASAPDFAGKKAELEAARNDISVARRGAMPSSKLSYAHDYEDGKHFNGFGIGISLPSWQPKKSVRMAEAKAIAADFDVLDYDIVRKARLNADYNEARHLYERIANEREVLANDYPALLKKAFDSGIFTIFEYLTEYNTYLDTLAEHNALIVRYAEIEAQLARYISFNAQN